MGYENIKINYKLFYIFLYIFISTSRYSHNPDANSSSYILNLYEPIGSPNL